MIDEKKLKAAGKKLAEAMKAWTAASFELSKTQVELERNQRILISPPDVRSGGGQKIADANIKIGKLMIKLVSLQKKVADKQRSMTEAQKAYSKLAPKK